MDHMEMVEKLRAKANVSYEEARNALEKNDWDMLDALVMLEGEGKTKADEKAAEFTTQETKQYTWESRNGHLNVQVAPGARRLWDWIKSMVRKGNKNQFVIARKGEEIIAMPITVMVLLVLIPRVGLPTILVALFVGLLLGARYSFRGPDISTKVNDVMNSAQEKAAHAVEVRKNENEEGPKDDQE